MDSATQRFHLHPVLHFFHYLHNVNRELIQSGGQYLDYTSHHYNGTSGNSEPTQRIDLPTDPYGSDIKSIDTNFADSDTYGENVIVDGHITDKNGNLYANDKSTTGGVSRVIDIKGTGALPVQKSTIVFVVSFNSTNSANNIESNENLNLSSY